LFCWGIFLKSCFADSFALFTSYAFGRSGPIEFGAAWVGSIAYAFQIYFDFCGYSLMAIGIGRCLGFTFPQNFNKPYHAVSVQDFWRRWHMTLSSWLRDYLYISLGGNKKGPRRTYINLFLTMLLGGIWHGADWGFVVWGAWHGSALLVERALMDRRAATGKTPFNLHLHRAVTLLVVLFGWVVFRATKLPEGFKILKTMLNPLHNHGPFNPDGLWGNPMHLALAIAGLLYCIALEPRLNIRGLETMVAPTTTQRIMAVAMLALSLLILYSAPTVPFIYFQF
jgi:alginate O-acetyltransferase complex protein AlgI